VIRSSVARQARRSIPVYAILIAVIAIMQAISPSFRTQDNFINVIAQVAPLAIVAVGQTIVALLGGIDLSVGSVMSLTTVIMAVYGGSGGATMVGAIALSLLAGAMVGAVNALGVVKLKIPPLIMTLSTMAIGKGIALYILPYPGGLVPMPFALFVNRSSGWFSMLGLITALIYLIFGFILSSTTFGRHLYATGGNSEAARRSGVMTDQVKAMGYVLGGLVAAFAGLVLAARIYSGDPVIGDSFSMDSVAAVVLGGTSLAGGVGGVIGTLAGSILLAIFNNVLNLLNVFSFYQYIVKGCVLLFALLFYNVGRKS
jgi:ribose transport system permease protein